MNVLDQSTVETLLPVNHNKNVFFYILLKNVLFASNEPVIDQRMTYVVKLRNGVPSASTYLVVDMVVRWLVIQVIRK